MSYAISALIILVLIAVGLLILRRFDARSEDTAWQELTTLAGGARGVFNLEMIAGLPEPAQRYFKFCIASGTPLTAAAEIEMHGELGLGCKEKPGYKPMVARQILAPPFGFVWRVHVAAISGSDGATPDSSWTKFRLFGVLPVVRINGDTNHRRSAFGRFVAEGVFWTPAALLPGEYVRWEAIDDNSARVIVAFGEFEQAVELSVAEDGAPRSVVMQRWSNENPQKEFRYQPFGGVLSDFRQFGGFTLPTSVEGGNHIGTNDYFPFYKARVSALRPL